MGAICTCRPPRVTPIGSCAPHLSRACLLPCVMGAMYIPKEKKSISSVKSYLPPLPPAIFTTCRPDLRFFSIHSPVCPCGFSVHIMPKRNSFPSSSWVWPFLQTPSEPVSHLSGPFPDPALTSCPYLQNRPSIQPCVCGSHKASTYVLQGTSKINLAQ